MLSGNPCRKHPLVRPFWVYLPVGLRLSQPPARAHPVISHADEEPKRLPGISTASATRLAFRRKWRRQHGNDGAARVAVPVGEDRPADDDRTTKQGDVIPVIRVLQAAVASLTAARDQAEVRADRAEARADALRAKLEAALSGRGEALAAAQAADELRRVEAARRAASLLARLRAAWRGE